MNTGFGHRMSASRNFGSRQSQTDGQAENFAIHYNIVAFPVMCGIVSACKALRRSFFEIWGSGSAASGRKLKPPAVLSDRSAPKAKLTQVVDFHDNFG